MAGTPPDTLPFSVRQKLYVELRGTMAEYRHSRALAKLLVLAIEHVGKTTRRSVLTALVESGIEGRALEHVLDEWVTEMPDRRSTKWLVDRLSDAAGLRWAPQQPATTGALKLPRVERDRMERRFERLWERCIASKDDEPEPEQYADVMAAEIERIGAKHEAFALRVLQRRFPDVNGSKTLWFMELVERAKLSEPRTLLRLFEESLEIEWLEPVRDRRRGPRPYDPRGAYAKGDLVEHPKFGRGTVTVVEDARIRVLFADGERTLVARK